MHVSDLYLQNEVSNPYSLNSCLLGFPFTIHDEFYGNTSIVGFNTNSVYYPSYYEFTPTDENFQIENIFSIGNHDDTGDYFKFFVEFHPQVLGEYHASITVKYTLGNSDLTYVVYIEGRMSVDSVEINKVSFPDAISSVETVNPFAVMEIYKT